MLTRKIGRDPVGVKFGRKIGICSCSMLQTQCISVCPDSPIYYRPQTKFAKVMFLQLSVSHSVHRRGGGMRGGRGGMHGIWWDTVNERAVCILLESILVIYLTLALNRIILCTNNPWHQKWIQGGTEGAMAPNPSPVKISHKKDGRQRQPHRFHVSCPPLTRLLDLLLGTFHKIQYKTQNKVATV